MCVDLPGSTWKVGSPRRRCLILTHISAQVIIINPKALLLYCLCSGSCIVNKVTGYTLLCLQPATVKKLTAKKTRTHVVVETTVTLRGVASGPTSSTVVWSSSPGDNIVMPKPGRQNYERVEGDTNKPAAEPGRGVKTVTLMSKTHDLQPTVNTSKLSVSCACMCPGHSLCPN